MPFTLKFLQYNPNFIKIRCIFPSISNPGAVQLLKIRLAQPAFAQFQSLVVVIQVYMLLGSVAAGNQRLLGAVIRAGDTAQIKKRMEN